jgi:hypothetical protein
LRGDASGTRPGGHRPLAVAAGIGAVLLAAAGGVSAAPRDAATDDLGGPSGRWISVGLLSGSTWLDTGLADYQWDVTPRMDWGAQALVGGGRFATGLRLWRSRTTQQIDPADATLAADVRATSTELVGRGRLTTALRCEVMAVASAGLLHLGYHPDHVTITPTGGGAAITVDLEPVNEWIGGAGLALRRPLRGPWAAGVEMDHRLFGLDTAHRNGAVIEYGRQRFGDWSARLELAWVSRRP